MPPTSWETLAEVLLVRRRPTTGAGMKRYHFSLEAVLRVRRAQEEAATFALAEANRQRRLAVDAHRAAVVRYEALAQYRGAQDHASFACERDIAERGRGGGGRRLRRRRIRLRRRRRPSRRMDGGGPPRRRPRTPRRAPRGPSGASRSNGPRWRRSTSRPSPAGWPSPLPRARRAMTSGSRHDDRRRRHHGGPDAGARRRRLGHRAGARTGRAQSVNSPASWPMPTPPSTPPSIRMPPPPRPVPRRHRPPSPPRRAFSGSAVRPRRHRAPR